jgi:hypothetical protein
MTMTEKHDTHAHGDSIRPDAKKRKIVHASHDASRTPTISPSGEDEPKRASLRPAQSHHPDNQEIVKSDRIHSLNLVFDTTREALDAMKQGDKISIKDLSNQVAEKLDLAVSAVKDLVGLAAHNYDGVEVSRGRFGGVFKGERIKKEIRPKCQACGQTIRAKKNSKNENGAMLNAAKGNSSHEEDDEDSDQN